jgi:predicted nucleic acid-binding Zn ribbon protein
MGEHSMQDAIQQFLRGSKIRGSIQAMQIEEVWEHLMGKTIARYTKKIQLFGGKLVITTDVAPLKQELVYQKEKIKQRVNEMLKENLVNEVIIQ